MQRSLINRQTMSQEYDASTQWRRHHHRTKHGLPKVPKQQSIVLNLLPMLNIRRHQALGKHYPTSINQDYRRQRGMMS